jgi:hypothetical protein
VRQWGSGCSRRPRLAAGTLPAGPGPGTGWAGDPRRHVPGGLLGPKPADRVRQPRVEDLRPRSRLRPATLEFGAALWTGLPGRSGQGPPCNGAVRPYPRVRRRWVGISDAGSDVSAGDWSPRTVPPERPRRRRGCTLRSPPPPCGDCARPAAAGGPACKPRAAGRREQLGRWTRRAAVPARSTGATLPSRRESARTSAQVPGTDTAKIAK